MTEFTKGKWEVVQGAGVDELDILSGDAPLHNHICVLFGYPTSRRNEQKVNARLIAAAPDMYYELYDAFQLMKAKSCYEGDVFAQKAKSILELMQRIIEGSDSNNLNSI